MRWLALAALLAAALVVLAASAGGWEPDPAAEALGPADPSGLREGKLRLQLRKERRVGGRAERRLIRRVRSAREDLGELAEPLGKRPRFPWRRLPAAWPTEQRLAKQLYRERHDRADRRFWLASNLGANSHLLGLVRHPSPAGNRELAAQYFGWEYPCAAEIIAGESNWDHLVWNRQGSGAYGLGQARPRSKMLAYGADAYTNPLTQLRWFRGYAEGRYGSVCGAAAHWNATVSW